MKKTVFLFTTLALFLTSCILEPVIDPDNNGSDVNQNGQKNGYLAFSGDGEEKKTNISPHGYWTISVAPSSWLSVSPKTGKNSATIHVKALPNPDRTPRSGAIIISTDNENSTIKVEQGGSWLESETRSLQFTSTGGTDLLKILASGKWNIKTSDSWIEVMPSSGKGNADIIVSTSDNPSSFPREGTVTLLSEVHSISIPLTQKSRYLSVSTDSVHYSKLGGTYTVKVETDGVFDVKIDEDWFSLEKGDGTITINVAENASPYPRESFFYVYLKNLAEGDVECKISIIQDGLHFGKEKGYEWVDLGLPSGTLWSTINIGAVPSEIDDYFENSFGNYYAWGETKTKNFYGDEWWGYKWFNGNALKTTFSKYNTSSSYGEIDNKTQLDLEDDAANVIWGGRWRIPTKEEWEELIAECEWTVASGKNVITSKSNGCSINLPLAGYVYEYQGYAYGAYSDCYYWSSSLDSGRPAIAWCLHGGSEPLMMGIMRCHGLTIRPVCHP